METNLLHGFSNLKLADVCLFLPHAAKSLTSVLGSELQICFLKLVFVFSLLLNLFCIGISHLLDEKVTRKDIFFIFALEV